MYLYISTTSDKSRTETINFKAICSSERLVYYSTRPSEWAIASPAEMNLIIFYHMGGSTISVGGWGEQNANDCEEIWHACCWL